MLTNGIWFDSKAEAERYKVLLWREKKKQIFDLRTQVEFVLIPKCRKPDGKIQRETKYIADFCYTTDEGEVVVEDVKSKATITEAYKIKEKLMLWRYGIQVRRIMT